MTYNTKPNQTKTFIFPHGLKLNPAFDKCREEVVLSWIVGIEEPTTGDRKLLYATQAGEHCCQWENFFKHIPT